MYLQEIRHFFVFIFAKKEPNKKYLTNLIGYLYFYHCENDGKQCLSKVYRPDRN